MLGNDEEKVMRRKIRPVLTGTVKMKVDFNFCIVLRTLLPTVRLRIEVGGVGLRNKAVNQNFNAIKIY